MALQVWLPLNGNLNNQGLTNVTVTNSGATVDNNGKIGKCYAFDGSDDYIQIVDSNIPTILNGDFSVCMWIYNDDSSGRSVLFGNYSLSSGFFNIEKYTAEQVRFYWNGTPDYSTSILKLPTSTWSHLVVTKQGGNLKFYLNGELKDSPTVTITGTIASTSTTYRLGMDARTGTTAFKGKLNDFRIYDHVLSPREIEILSRGLVAHYPLSDSAVEATTNLVTSISAGGQTTVSGDTITTSGNNADTYFTLNLSENITVGTQYTISCDVSGVPSDQHWLFPLGSQVNGSLIWELKNGHNEYTFTANNIDWGTKRIFMDDTNRTFYGVTTFSHFQLEKKDHATLYAGLGGTRSGDTTVYDCSGYQYNGTANKAMTVSDNTARYSKCTVFDGDTDSIKIPFFEMLGSNTSASYSVSVWFYKTQIGSKNYQTILGGQSGFELETRSGSNPAVVLYSWGKGSASYELNKWNHIVFTRSYTDGTKLYLNGQLVIDNGTTGGIPSGNFYIGAWSNTSSQNFDGKISDFRVYATILTASQVAELYNTAVSVANNGSLLGYEFVEV